YDNGSFSAIFTVPSSVAGDHVVSATDGISIANAVFTLESETPLIPVPLLPEVAATAKKTAHFDWEDVTDPSGVTYVLQIASDDGFGSVILEKNNLADSEYTLTEEEKLGSTENKASYYWRVRAIDGAFNGSEWTTPRSCYVGFSWFSMPAWST
ncbi:unnamed protein product, partial [marine sediment metagenome]